MRDVLVVRRKGVPLQTEWTDPYPCSDINIATRVNDLHHRKVIIELSETYAKGLRTALHGALHVTGSY